MRFYIGLAMVITGSIGLGYNIGRLHEKHIQKKEGERVLAQLKKNAELWAQEHDDFMSGKTQTVH